MLDLTDFGRNPEGREFGEYGTLLIRYGKAKKVSPPKRRSVLTVWYWTLHTIEEWISEVRPGVRHSASRALWPSERGPRIGLQRLDSRFAAYHEAVGLDPAGAALAAQVLHHASDRGRPRPAVRRTPGHGPPCPGCAARSDRLSALGGCGVLCSPRPCSVCGVVSDLHGVRSGWCWFAGEDQVDGVFGGVFEGDVVRPCHLLDAGDGVAEGEGGWGMGGLLSWGVADLCENGFAASKAAWPGVVAGWLGNCLGVADGVWV